MTLYYKLLREDKCHHGFTYKEGLNVDVLAFHPYESCKPGGLYYTTLTWLPKWYTPKWPLIADVTVPPDAQVYDEPCGTKSKADKIILSNIRPLGEFFAELDEDTMCTMLTKEPWMLQSVTKQTEAMCMAAVRKHGDTLQCVHHQTELICLIAVHERGYALEYVKTQTEEICLAAVRDVGWALQYVKEQTPLICCAAVSNCPAACRYVKISY